jgi:hypothetical protein
MIAAGQRLGGLGNAVGLAREQRHECVLSRIGEMVIG